MQGIVHPCVACHCKSLRIPFLRVGDILVFLRVQSTFPPQIYSLDIGKLKLKHQSCMEHCPAQFNMCFTSMDHALY